jgi:hypothetical protein
MRLSLISSALAAAFCLAVASPAAAQRGDQSKTPPPSTPAITAVRWDAHPVGTYNLEITLPERVMPARLTVTEVDGKLVASLWPEGDNDAHEMSVSVKDTDLVFDADAPKGHVQLVLQHEGDRIAGSWTFGPDRGTLRGTIAR